MFKPFLILASLILSLILGVVAFSWFTAKPEAPAAAPEAELAQSLRLSDPQRMQELSGAMSAAMDALNAREHQLSLEKFAEIDAKLESLEPGDREREIEAALGRSEIANTVRKLLLSQARQLDDKFMPAYQRELFKDLERKPEESYDVIVGARDRLSQERFGVERYKLIKLAALLPGKQDAAQRQLSQEALNPEQAE